MERETLYNRTNFQKTIELMERLAKSQVGSQMKQSEIISKRKQGRETKT